MMGSETLPMRCWLDFALPSLGGGRWTSMIRRLTEVSVD